MQDPNEIIDSFSARFDMALPSEDERRKIIQRVADAWAQENPGSRVQADAKAYELLVRNLAGLTYRDTEQLAHNAIFLDGAITRSDLPGVMQAKYELLNRGGALQFDYDTARFSDVGGLARLKKWLAQRKSVFRGDDSAAQPGTLRSELAPIADASLTSPAWRVASNTLTPGGVGTVILESPISLTTALQSGQSIPGQATLTLSFVPEPGAAAGLLAGALLLLALEHRSTRSRARA